MSPKAGHHLQPERKAMLFDEPCGVYNILRGVTPAVFLQYPFGHALRAEFNGGDTVAF